MSMSDCQMCWETPCACGWDYMHWSADRLDEQIRMLQAVREWRETHPKGAESWGAFVKFYNDVVKARAPRSHTFPFPVTADEVKPPNTNALFGDTEVP